MAALNPNQLFAIAFMLAATIDGEFAFAKPYKMVMMASFQYTENDPFKSIDCTIAAKMAVETANGLESILPDYELTVEYTDEKSVGSNSPNNLLKFSQRFDEGQTQDNVYPSPVIVGPMNSNGCKAVGYILHHINYLAISTTCTASVLDDRAHFPNLYLTIPTANPKNYGYVHFIKDLGGWKRCALATSAENINNYNTALSFQKIAVDQGVEIPWFYSIIQFDTETAYSLKNSGARIIVLIVSSPAYVAVFFCKAYEIGITGPRYIFFLYDTGFPDPRTFPETPACKRFMLAQQIKSSYWMGNLDGNAELTQKTDFGYSRLEFDTTFDKRINFEKAIDYDWRLSCHDSTMQAILTLDKADRMLKADNMSLRSFYTNPKRVVDSLNQASLSIDYKGLRTPRLRYDSSGILYGLPSYINYWTPETGFQKVFAIFKFENTSTFSYDSYRVQQIEKATWLTTDGKPPRDSQSYVKRTMEAPTEIRIAVAILSGLFAFAQLIGTFSYHCLFQRSAVVQQTMPDIKTIGLLGCVLLDVAAVVFVVETKPAPFAISSARIFLLVISFAMVNGVVLFRVYFCRSMIRRCIHAFRATMTNFQVLPNPSRVADIGSNNRDQNKLSELPDNFPTSSSPMPRTQIAKVAVAKISLQDCFLAEKKAVRTLVIFLVGHSIALMVWLLVDGMNCFKVQPNPPFYDQATDTLYEDYATICHSTHQQAWMFSITGVHILLLCVACFLVFEMRSRKSDTGCPEFATIALAVINVTAILAASIFILLVLQNPIGQQVAVAFLSLAVSATTSATWLVAVVKHFTGYKKERPASSLTTGGIGSNLH